MKIQYVTLQSAVESLKKLSQHNLPFKTAYKLSKIIKSVDSEMSICSEYLNNLIKTLGKEQPDGQIAILPTDKEAYTQFVNEQANMMKSEIELDFTKIPVKEIENLDFTAHDLLVLEPFIDFEENQNDTTDANSK